MTKVCDWFIQGCLSSRDGVNISRFEMYYQFFEVWYLNMGYDLKAMPSVKVFEDAMKKHGYGLSGGKWASVFVTGNVYPIGEATGLKKRKRQSC